MQRESSLLLDPLLLGPLLLRRNVYKSKVWVPESFSILRGTQNFSLFSEGPTTFSLFSKGHKTFFSIPFLYVLFNYPKLFLYSQRGTKLFFYSQRGPKLFLWSFPLFAISLPKTFSLFFFSIHYFVTQNFFLFSERPNTFSLFSEGPKTFSLFFFSTGCFNSKWHTLKSKMANYNWPSSFKKS